MFHPFDLLPRRWRLWLFLAFLAGTVSLMLHLTSLDKELRGKDNERYGILEFELAYWEKDAAEMVCSWSHAKVLDTARRSLAWDFLFIVCYATLFSSCWSFIARGHRQLYISFRKEARYYCAAMARNFFVVCAVFSLFQWLGGLLDVIENCALLYMLETGVSSPWPEIAARVAQMKFALVLSAPLYAVALIPIADKNPLSAALQTNSLDKEQAKAENA